MAVMIPAPKVPKKCLSSSAQRKSLGFLACVAMRMHRAIYHLLRRRLAHLRRPLLSHSSDRQPAYGLRVEQGTTTNVMEPETTPDLQAVDSSSTVCMPYPTARFLAIHPRWERSCVEAPVRSVRRDQRRSSYRDTTARSSPSVDGPLCTT